MNSKELEDRLPTLKDAILTIQVQLIIHLAMQYVVFQLIIDVDGHRTFSRGLYVTGDIIVCL